MRSVVFEVQGKVIGKARPRVTRVGHAYTPATTRLYEKAIRDAFLAAGGSKISGYVHVDFEATTKLQASATKAQKAMRLEGKELATSKPDIDNIEKALLDAISRGVAFDDDVQVVSVRKIKGRYETEPRLIVRVREITADEVAEIHSWMWGNEA